MASTLKRLLTIGAAILIIVALIAANISTPMTIHAQNEHSTPGYQPGQILVKFKNGPVMQPRLTGQAGELLKILHTDKAIALTTLQVPAGQEQATLTYLRKQPGVAYATLNWILTANTPPIKPPSTERESFSNTPAAIAQTGNIFGLVSNLRMITPQGVTPRENKFPSGTAIVDAAFDYNVSAQGEPLRLNVIYDPIQPSTVLTVTNVYTGVGSGRERVTVGATFPNRPEFPVGQYQTVLLDTPDQGQTWKPITSTTWNIITHPNEDFYDGYQWNLNNLGQRSGTPGADIDAPEAWDYTTGSRDIVIAIVDSGIDLTHPDLASKLWRNPREVPDNGVDDDHNGLIDDVYGYDFSGRGSPRVQDLTFGSGTMAAGIMAAATNNSKGIAGVSWGARLMAVKVLDENWSTSIESMVQGITYAVNQGAKIIYIGFNAVQTQLDPEDLQPLRDAVDYAHAQGALVIAPAGDCLNDCPGSNVYPAAFEPVLAVAGTDKYDRVTAFSNSAPHVAVSAPAIDFYTTWWFGDQGGSKWARIHTEAARTSWAAAHVAGVASLVWSINPHLPPDEVKRLIQASADKVHADEIGYSDGGRGRNDYYGYGRVNTYKAVLLTPHFLTLDRSEIRFLTDTPTKLCYQVQNLGSSGYSWRAIRADGAPWLTLSGPYGHTPSILDVCADPSQIPDHGAAFGTYTDSITITSALPTHVNNPFKLSVTLIYTSAVQRQFLPLMGRK